MAEELAHYPSRAARALVLLHEDQLRQCLSLWKRAKGANIRLPETQDADYQSLETLLHHLLRSARIYMVKICENLGLPDPGIRTAPDVGSIGAEADSYVEHPLERWRLPLADVPDDRLEPAPELYTAGMPYWIDAMLEHAVVHPIRHGFQLRELLERQAGSE